jgi:hypothetical protein
MRVQCAHGGPTPCLGTRFGGVGGFFPSPSVQVRKRRPGLSFFTARQTQMPELDQPPFYIEGSKCPRRSASCFSRLWSYGSSRVFPSSRKSGTGIGTRAMTIPRRPWANGSRCSGFRLPGRSSIAGSFSDRVIHAARLSGSHLVVAVGIIGIGNRQKVAFRWRRLRLALLDHEHQCRKNHGAQNSRRQPSSIAIEFADRVAFHLSLL